MIGSDQPEQLLRVPHREEAVLWDGSELDDPVKPLPPIFQVPPSSDDPVEVVMVETGKTS